MKPSATRVAHRYLTRAGRTAAMSGKFKGEWPWKPKWKANILSSKRLGGSTIYSPFQVRVHLWLQGGGDPGGETVEVQVRYSSGRWKWESQQVAKDSVWALVLNQWLFVGDIALGIAFAEAAGEKPAYPH